MYINNCYIGINARKNAHIDTSRPIHAHNISNVAIVLADNSVMLSSVTPPGPTGETGPSGDHWSALNCYNVDVGIYANNSHAVLDYPRLRSCRFGCVASNNSSIELNTAIISGLNSTPVYPFPASYGVHADTKSLVKCFDAVVDGYTGQTGGTFPDEGPWKAVNDAVIYVENTTKMARISTNTPPTGGRPGFAAYDTLKGLSIIDVTNLGEAQGVPLKR